MGKEGGKIWIFKLRLHIPRFVQMAFAKWVGAFQGSSELQFTQTYDFILGGVHVAQASLDLTVTEDDMRGSCLYDARD